MFRLVMVNPSAQSSLIWIAWDFISCRDNSAFSHTWREMRRIAGLTSDTVLAAVAAEGGGAAIANSVADPSVRAEATKPGAMKTQAPPAAPMQARYGGLVPRFQWSWHPQVASQKPTIRHPAP